MESYLEEHHHEDVTNLFHNEDDIVHVSVKINLTHLQRTNVNLYNSLLLKPWEEYRKWNKCLLEVQKKLVNGNMFLEDEYQIKTNCHVRFINMPLTDPKLKVIFPSNDNVGQFVQIKGNVVRITQARLLEYKRDYNCNKCKQTVTCEAEYTKMFVFAPPKICNKLIVNNDYCKGILQQKSIQPQPEYCMDFQEIRIQELLSEKNIPSSLIITLENDLVDTCQPGDCITVCGTIERRWKPLVPGKKAEVIISMRAISICREEERNISRDLPEHLMCVRVEWEEIIEEYGELYARDLILQSFCPEVHGMSIVKLAVTLSLCSSVERHNTNGSSIRGHSHLLLVGDPGLAKSKLIQAASQIALRSVHTTGMGCSSAGLTAAAIKEDGEWQLEAGALVLADGGVCCIDEFNLMRECDKASIHEAMEQQTISMAKAGIVCKLSSRCVVLAATNPKNLYSMCENEGTSSINIGIASPLLSRFDMVLILRDERNLDWDIRVADHILHNKINEKTLIWNKDKLQSHFLIVKNIQPKITPEANEILGTYYKLCRNDAIRDLSRTSVRLLDSLVRLSQAHARLVLRNIVTIIDAVMVIRLIESSWGFGRVLTPLNILTTSIPLGPFHEDIIECLDQLQLSDLKEKYCNNELSYADKNNTYPYRKDKINETTIFEADVMNSKTEEEFTSYTAEKCSNVNLEKSPTIVDNNFMDKNSDLQTDLDMVFSINDSEPEANEIINPIQPIIETNRQIKENKRKSIEVVKNAKKSKIASTCLYKKPELEKQIFNIDELHNKFDYQRNKNQCKPINKNELVKEFILSKSQSKNFDSSFFELEDDDDDIDDDLLKFEDYVTSNIKHLKNKMNEKRPEDHNIEEIVLGNKVQQICEKTSPKQLSNKTLMKLNAFRVDDNKTGDQDNRQEENKTPQNETNDSAYDTLKSDYIGNSSSSYILGNQSGNMDYFNVDF